MRNISFFIIFFSVSYILTAQKIHFMGVVKDSTGQALASASVVTAHLKTGAFQGFAITDEQGNFLIDLNTQQTYAVKVSYMGYLPVVDTLIVKDKDVIKQYVLKPDRQQLDGVEIKYEMPVSIKGDTIVYNADSFTNGTEKKLGDVLKKMPGIEVEKDGTVKVEGKKVNKVMVEGKNFFEGDSKLASKNIPANAVKKVQVLRNYNENSQLRNFEDNEDSYAINIKLKEGKKNFWFGDITAGGGTDAHYLLHPKLFYYSPKKTYNIIVDGNNNGSAPMSFSDYFKLTGGLRSFQSKSGSFFNNSSDMLGFSLSQNEKALAMQTEFGALNFNYTLNPKLMLDGFIIINQSKTDMFTDKQKLYTVSGINEQSHNYDSQNNLTGVVKTSLEYNPNPNLNIKYDILGKLITMGQTDRFDSSVRASTESKNRDEGVSLKQNLELYKTLKNNDLFTFSIQHNYQDKQPLLEILSPEAFFTTSSLINMTPQQTYDLLQHQNLKSNDLSAVTDYYYVINDASHVDFSLGTKTVWQDFNSGISQKLDNGQEHRFVDRQLLNDAQYRFVDIYAGAYYKILTGKFTFRPGISAHYYRLNDRQFGTSFVQTKKYLLPQLSIKYNIDRSKRLSLSYKMINNFSDVKQYAAGFIINSFGSLKSGNRILRNVLQHQVNLRFSIFNMIKFSHFFSGITYRRSLHPIRQNSRQYQTDIISLPVNLNNSDENMSAYLTYGKRFIYWKLRLNAQLNASKYFNIINQREIASNSLTQNYGFTANSNLSGFFNFDVGYNININRFDSDLGQSTYTTHKPFAGIELRFFKQTTQLNLKYDYYDQTEQDKNQHNTYGFLNGELYYQKEGSSWEFSLKAHNLLNTKSINKENLTDLYLSTSQYYVMPSYWLLQVKYKL